MAIGLPDVKSKMHVRQKKLPNTRFIIESFSNTTYKRIYYLLRAVMIWQVSKVVLEMSYQATVLKKEPLSYDTLKTLRLRRANELEYLSDMLPQLREMALGMGEHTLARLLEIAMMEAQLQHDMAKMQAAIE